MFPMISHIQRYMTRSDATGFWIECDGNTVTANKITEDIWKAECEFWTGKKKTIVMPKHRLLDAILQKVPLDEFAVCSCFEAPTRWAEHDIQDFLAELALKMCQQEFGGFKLSANEVSPFTVQKTPQSMIVWRINGCESDFAEVLQHTRKKLEENVYWIYSEI